MFEAVAGTKSVELDAIHPDLLRGLVRDDGRRGPDVPARALVAVDDARARIFVAVMGFNLLGDALRDALDVWD